MKMIEVINNYVSKPIELKKIYLLESRMYHFFFNFHSPILLLLNGIHQISFLLSQRQKNTTISTNFYITLVSIQASLIIISFFMQKCAKKLWAKFIYRSTFNIFILEYTYQVKQVDDDTIQLCIFFLFFIKSIRDVDNALLQMTQLLSIIIYLGVRFFIFNGDSKSLFILIISGIMSFFLSIEPYAKVQVQEQQSSTNKNSQCIASKNQNMKRDDLFSFQDNYSKQMIVLHKIPSVKNSGSTVSLNKLTNSIFYNNNINNSVVNNQSYFAMSKPLKMIQQNLSEIDEVRVNDESQIHLLEKSLQKFPVVNNSELIFGDFILNMLQSGIVMTNNHLELVYSNTYANKFFKQTPNKSFFSQLMEMKVKQKIGKDPSKKISIMKNNNFSSIAKDRQSRFDTSFSEILNNNTNLNSFSKKKQINSSDQDDLKTSFDQKPMTKSQFSMNKNRKSLLGGSLNQINLENMYQQDKNKKRISILFDYPHNQQKSQQKIQSRSRIQKDINKHRSLSSISLTNQQQPKKKTVLQQKEKSYRNLNNYRNLKQQIMPLSVLDIFKKEDVMISDIVSKIFSAKKKEKKNMFYSATELQFNDQFDDTYEITNQQRSENENRSFQQRRNADLIDSNKLNYYIERNNLVITFSQKGGSVQYMQLKMGVYQNIIDQDQSGDFDDTNEEIFILIEIADQSQIQVNMQERDISEYKNRMLSSVSHELRTPLNCSIQMLEMILIKFSEEQINRIQLVGEQSSYFDEIKETLVKPALLSNQLLLNIINDILDYGQINSGYLKLVFQPFSILELMTECAEMIYFQAALKGLTIELHLDPNLPDIVHSDRNRIRQVLLNLLSNSLKFTDSGFIEINVENQSEELIRVEVCDTGCGIPEENLYKIFECFGDKSRSSILNTQGAGLGLSIANSLAMGIGGNRRIQVESIENEGTTFSFFIVNRSLNKKGCQFNLKDIFNQRVMKWDTITHWDQNITQSTSSHQIVQKGLKNIQTNTMKTNSKLNAINQEITTGRSNTNEINADSIQNDAFSQKSLTMANNLIVFSLKPTSKFMETCNPAARTRSTSMNQTINNTQKKYPGTNKISSLIEQVPSLTSFGDEKQYDIQKTQKIDLKNLNFKYGVTQNIPNESLDLTDSCQIIEENSKDLHSPPNESVIKTAIKNSQNYKSIGYNDTLNPNLTNLTSKGSSELNNSKFFEQFQLSDEKRGIVKNRVNSGSQESSKICSIDKQLPTSQLTQKYADNPQLLLSEQRKENILKLLQTINSKQKCKCSNILIVDDNDFNLYVLFLRLKTYGFQVDKATSGDMAIEKVKDKYKESDCCKKYKLIFMDIDMPIKDGNQTTIEINSYFRNKNTKPTPISACTAYVQEKEINKAFESGMKFYITKPINQRELEEVLLTVFQKSP